MHMQLCILFSLQVSVLAVALPRVQNAAAPAAVSMGVSPITSQPVLPLRTQGRNITDAKGSRVRLRCVSWSGAQVICVFWPAGALYFSWPGHPPRKKWSRNALHHMARCSLRTVLSSIASSLVVFGVTVLANSPSMQLCIDNMYIVHQFYHWLASLRKSCVPMTCCSQAQNASM